MKRLVTLGITLALVMGLFCFSVNAENIVIQGESDTVTATYGDNDITIALRARKLRVINTGTAAAGYAGYTPVIVSVTIYNLGNQNCLVNNLKFRLTSESAEYRIAGFENISPDLFISDTAYDATGYLSLKASNDYTYAGGFVVPANSNMTYVGIINVSANWITENQTWRTVDLSTATFYDNLTTTVGEYHCDAEPVDLTGIEESFDTVITAVQGIDLDTSTIHTLVQDLVNLNSYTGSMPDNINQSPLTYNYDVTEDNVRTLINIVVGRPYYIDNELVLNSTSDTYYSSSTVRYPIAMRVFIQNNGQAFRVNNIMRLKNVFPGIVNRQPLFYINTFYSDIYSHIHLDTSQPHNVELYLDTIADDFPTCGVIPNGRFDTFLVGYIDMPSNVSLGFNPSNISLDEFYRNKASITGYYPTNEYTILRDLYLAYSSVNGIDDLSDAASDAAAQSENIHNQEASYYAQNQAAIEATGLNNFQFSGEQSNGIGSVSNDFTALWNALGSWNSVYIFSMTLTLALTILRHMPNRRRPKEDKKE